MKQVGGGPIYEIYVDIYFLFNFWMNLWVLFLCRFFLQEKVSKWRVIICALLGTMGEVTLMCFWTANSSLKIVLGYGGITAWICYLLFRPRGKYLFYKTLIYCYFSAAFMGSILLGIESIVGMKKLSFETICILVVFLVLWFEIMYLKWKEGKNFCEVEIYFSDEAICRVKALIDTGNGLIEPISNTPVSLVEEDIMKPYKDKLREENFRLVPFHSIGMDKGVLEAYFVEKMEICKKEGKIRIDKPMIAITKETISQSGKYEMILHPSIIG